MASEPTDDPVSVSLPPDLAEWVDQQAAEQDTDRETVLVRLLAAHQATAELENGDEIDADLLAQTTDLEDEVRSIIADRLSDIAGAAADRIDVEAQVESALDERLATAVDEQVSATLDDRLSAAIEEQLAAALDEELAETIDQQVTDSLDDRLDDLSQSATEQATREATQQIESVESDFMEKIEDVREKIVRVKKEADKKAPAEHTHSDIDGQLTELETDIEELATTTDELGAELEEIQDELDTKLDSQEERLDDLDETIWDMQEKLRTVAYVVNDLRESSAFDNKRDTSVEQIKRSAAEHDIDRANCEACGQGVSIALMTDPECPHCEATVTDVEPSDGFFGKPQLVKAQGIEAASESEDS